MFADDPFDRVLASLARHGCRVHRPGPGRARAICPAHRDARPSLAVTRSGTTVLMKCFAGCNTRDVLSLLGLRMVDLFTPGQTQRLRPEIVAEYPYHDQDGRLIARKVRLSPKAFRWQRHDPLAARKWPWGLEALEPGLYRLPELAGKPEVFCLEGEKAVDHFWGLGLPATCPPSGASRWSEAWGEDLKRSGCRELVILADADKAGFCHAERVAAATFALAGSPMRIKVVRLPGLCGGADAFDWLQGGRTAAELLNVVSAAPYWLPGAVERERQDRRRALTRERVRRHRERQKLLQSRPLALASGL